MCYMRKERMKDGESQRGREKEGGTKNGNHEPNTGKCNKL